MSESSGIFISIIVPMAAHRFPNFSGLGWLLVPFAAPAFLRKLDLHV